MRLNSAIARTACCVMTTAFVFACTVDLTYGVVASLVRREPSIRLEVLELLASRIAALGLHRERPNIYRIAFLGDSTVASYPYRSTLPEQLTARFLHSGLVPKIVEAHSLAFPGLSPFEFYFFSDRILQAEPDLVILPVNLATTSIGWRSRMSSPELSIWLPPRHILQAMALPLNWIGLTADRLIYYTVLGAAGGFDQLLYHSIEQARVGSVQQALECQLFADKACSADAEVKETEGGRLSAHGAIRNFGPALSGLKQSHPVLRAYDAAVRSYVSAGVPLIAYIVPANVEHFGAIGVYDPARVSATIGSITTVLTGAGATVVDLHDLFPDNAFRDAAGHFKTDAEYDGTGEVARALTPYVVAEIERILPEDR